MPTWGFLTNHALVLLCIARDPGVRLRDIAASVGITERSAFGIVSDLAAAGYIVKEKGGRRNRYRVETTFRCRSRPTGISPSATCWPSSGARTPSIPARSRNRPDASARGQPAARSGPRNGQGWRAPGRAG